MENRYSKGESKLYQYERTLQKERDISKRLGKKLPEESVRIPKIGEWNLSSDFPEQFVTDKKQKKKLESKPRSKTVMAPYKIQTPKLFTSAQTISEPRVNFPAGTTSTDLTEILRAKHRSASRALPPISENKAPPEPQFLPLEFFDDSTFEEYPVEELMKEPVGYSRYQDLNGECYWAKCKVLSYDPESRLFLIEWDGTGKRKKVARFNLRFEKEDPIKFEIRVHEAKKACAMQEIAIKFENRVNQMPTANLPELSEEDMVLITKKMNIEVTDKYESLFRSLCEEVKENFKKVNNELEFEYELDTNPLIPNRDEFLLLKEPPKPVPEYGVIELENYDFKERLKEFSDRYLLSQPAIQRGVYQIWGIFQNSDKLTFLTRGSDDVLQLQDFITIEYKHLESSVREFKNAIQETIDGVVSSTLTEEVGGMREREKVKYMNLIGLTTRMLHTVLLQIIDKTLKLYNGLFSDYLQEGATLEPKFMIEIVFGDNHMSFTPSIPVFNDQLLSLLSQLESSVNDLTQIQSPTLEQDTTQISFQDCIKLVRDEKSVLMHILESLFSQATGFLGEYTYLEQVLALDPEEYVTDFDPQGNKTLDEYRKQHNEFQRLLNTVQNEMKQFYKIGMFKISCKSFKDSTTFHIKSLIYNFLNQVKKYANKATQELYDEFISIAEELKKVPQTPEELAAMKKYLEHVYNTVKDRSKRMQAANDKYAFLEEFQFEITNEEFQFHYQTLQMPQKISLLIDEAERMLSVERIRMIRDLRSNQRKLESETLAVTELLTSFTSKFTDLDLAFDAVEQINEIGKKLQSLKEEQEKYNSHEKLFEFEQATCRILVKLVEEFTPLHTLWNLANNWRTQKDTWLSAPFQQIRPDTLNLFIAQSSKTITKLKKELIQQRTLVEKVLNPLSAEIEAFKKDLPLISRLRHPAVKTQHWEAISKVVGFQVIPTKELTLQGFLDLDLNRWSEPITEIASVAAQEYTLDSTLESMDRELEEKKFTTQPFKNSGHFILVDIDDIVTIIDEQLVTTQTILTSPFIAPVKQKALDKLAFLKKSQACLNSWIQCQKSWLYLQPIFTGTSIQQKLRKEAGEWLRVDKLWSSVMTLTRNHPSFNTVMDKMNSSDSLDQCNQLLESITNGLNAYLESKRLGFPRFFFLSNQELIDILSHTKDFDVMQGSIPKLFEYVNSFTYTEDLTITHFNDSKGESVQMLNPVSGNTPEIEDWLNAFEEEMHFTLKESIRDALGTYPKKKKDQWIGDFPAQVILISNQILWTQQVTNVLKGQKLRGLKVLQSKFMEQLDLLTEMARKPLDPKLRQVLSCVLINEVHNRDIISSLISDEVSDAESFKWIKQLRYYWEEETVFVRSINNSFEYAYEYAGNSERLVFTPLTDRCYQTLLAAFKQYLSGAPSGPAGTGKTETVRDCAKALGRPCVVYNCSSEVTVEQMSQFFSGLASSGAWACFDEFNRINIEVLSVIAQQVRTIQSAIASGAETFKLDGRTLKVHPNAAICITMNPGYAGRTELPDNLKALFRPCAMMVPDVTFISEILLFSAGFAHAQQAAVKLAAVFDLCKKQLSNSRHYDWGLRAIKAILRTAGKVKRDNLDKDEFEILANVLRDCTLPRLISVDIPLFDNLISDVFPGTSVNKVVSEELKGRVSDALKDMDVIPLPYTLDKAIDIYETFLVRHGIMLVGGPMGGKTTAWRALQSAMNSLAKDGKMKPVHVESLNPKAISIAELYGSFNPFTSQWADGVLSQSIRKCTFSDDSELKWIVVDGPVDSLWIESMNSLLDDNKVLCLSSNERIQLGAHVSLVFEVGDLSQASPATVSRCGMIFFDPENLTWEALVDAWAEKNSTVVTQRIKEMCSAYIPDFIQFILMDAKPVIDVSPNHVVANLLKLITAFLPLLRKPVQEQLEGSETKEVDPLNGQLFFSQFTTGYNEVIPYLEEEQAMILFERIFIFGLVWSFGALMPEESRVLFDRFMKDQLEKNQARCSFPPKYTVYDYYIDPSKFSWVLWTDGTTNINICENKPIEMEFIPTPESSALLYFTKLLSSSGVNMLMHGQESSKTLVVETLFNDIIDKNEFSAHSLALSSCSTPKQISSFMMSFMHRRHGQFGPLPNQKMVFFLDNLGACRPEEYGAQPPLELIRQFFDYGGWFNTETVEFNSIVGTSIIAAMGQSGGGLYDIPSRLLRHFFVIHTPKYKDQSLTTIVQNIMTFRFSKHQQTIKDMIRSTAHASIDMYNECSSNLFPVPSKLHYIFSLRNIIRVIKGMCLVSPQQINNETDFLKLWKHEMDREIRDRLNTADDRSWYDKVISQLCSKHFKISWESVCPDNYLLFNDFADGSQRYKLVTSKPDVLLSTCQQQLEEHNRDSTKPVDIILFHEAVDHLSSISRVLAMNKGHAMLVGVKSSGRKSLTRLALHLSNLDPFEISITRVYGFSEWREDLKKLVKQCGLQDVPTGFLISDVQIQHDYQFEDISNLLIKGEIPQLYERDEIDGIKAELAATEMSTDVDYYELFCKRAKKNLHIILVFSPYGTAFKDAMLSYPALRNETTIDWYLPWSQNALESVAQGSLSNGTIGSPDVVHSVVSICVKIHKLIEEVAPKFLEETKRFTAVTPSRFFELLQTFHKKLIVKQKETAEMIRDYENGVQKIQTTRAQIEIMSKQLDDDIPVLQNTRKEVEEMLKDLSVKQGEVEKTRQEVQKQSEQAAEEARQAGEINAVAQEQLAAAQPILNEAQEASSKLDRDSLVNMKRMHACPNGLKDLSDALCIMFKRQPRKVETANGVKEDDYWPETVSLLNEVQFIKNVTNFKGQDLTKDQINKLSKYVPQNKQQRAQIRKGVFAVSQSISPLYDWVCAQYDYWIVYQEILPKKIAAEEAEAKLQASEAELAKRKAHLKSVEDKLQELENNVKAMQDKEQELSSSVTKTQSRLSRAQKIMAGLSGETKRWSECAENLRNSAQFLLGDTLLVSGVLTYLGAFSPSYRKDLIEKWKVFLQHEGIKFSESFSISSALGNDSVIREWIVKGLPNDTNSIENALIITSHQDSFPLLIDPQLSGTKWLRSIEAEKLVVLHFDNPDFLQRMKSCVSFGIPVLIENVGLQLDPLIEPILSHEFLIIDGQKSVSLGGDYTPYNDNFRLYLSTKYPNPHYSPEVCSQVTLINFTTTQEGLTDLLLNNLIEVERDDLDKKRLQIMESNAENLKKLKGFEAEILNIVSSASSDILNDDTAIETLTRVQKTSALIEQQMAQSAKTEKQIAQFKSKFFSVAERAALLYFCVSDFSVVDPMYQFSLNWFVQIFRTAITQAEHVQDQMQMIQNFHSSIAKKFYSSVSFSLFSKHKLLFSILMAIRILFSERKISGFELSFLLSPKVAVGEKLVEWMSDEMWAMASYLPQVSPVFEDIVQSLQMNSEAWQHYIESGRAEEEPIPYKDHNLTPFQKIIILRVFNLPRVREGLRLFVEETLGKEFITPPTLNLLNVFKESSPVTPLIFIVQAGIDPQDEIISVAASMELEKYFKSYSLGRGRGAGAEELILDSAEKGFWVLLQNCHLSLSWMPRLEYILSNLDPEKVHPRFRICMTTMSDKDFPIGILYQGYKLVYEIPKGMRENVLRIYSGFNPDEYNDESVQTIEKQLLFHLAFFHSVVLERLQFGSVGWNIPYEFNPSDFAISKKHLSLFLSEAQPGEVPFEALSYVIGELNYGGRVTDNWDRRLLLTLLNKYFSEEINNSLFSFGPRYPMPDFDQKLEGIIEVVNKWPVVTHGEDVCLSQNATTITAKNGAISIFNSLLEVQPTIAAASGSTSEEEFSISIIDSYISRIPKDFNIILFKKKADLTDTLTMVLYHEIQLYNGIIHAIKSTLETARNGLKGMIVIDKSLEEFIHNILSNKIPDAWRSASYPSILNLNQYFSDFLERVDFMDQWVKFGLPNVFKLGAFYHPEEFLTAVLQIYARKHSIPFDSLHWKTIPIQKLDGQPEDGVFIEGLCLEGAKWDPSRFSLVECSKTEIISTLPLLYMIPTEDPNWFDKNSTYECPVYRTQNRGTGAMDLPNYIVSLYLPTGDKPPSHWIQRSVAGFITVN